MDAFAKLLGSQSDSGHIDRVNSNQKDTIFNEE
jgi:hypothetical protein